MVCAKHRPMEPPLQGAMTEFRPDVPISVQGLGGLQNNLNDALALQERAMRGRAESQAGGGRADYATAMMPMALSISARPVASNTAFRSGNR